MTEQDDATARAATVPSASPGRWSTLWIAAALVLAMTFVILARDADLVSNLRLLIRSTARTSAAFFLAAFTASVLYRFWPGALTAWIVRNRRQLGLSFAFSHTVHAIAIYNYWSIAPELFWQGRSVAANVPGTIGYVALIILVLTSNFSAVSALGLALWQRIHKYLMWTIFLVFFIAWGKRIHAQHLYAIPFLIFAAAAGLRLMSGRLKRN